MYDPLVKRVLVKPTTAGVIPEALRIGFVVRKKKRGSAFDPEPERTERSIDGFYFAGAHLTERRFGRTAAPAPDIAKPDRRQKMEASALGPAIMNGDARDNFIRPRFGVLD